MVPRPTTRPWLADDVTCFAVLACFRMLHVLPVWGLLAHPPTPSLPCRSHSSSRFVLPVPLSAIAICGLTVTKRVPLKLNGARTPEEASIPWEGKDEGIVGAVIRKDGVAHLAEVTSRRISTTDGTRNFPHKHSREKGFSLREKPDKNTWRFISLTMKQEHGT